MARNIKPKADELARIVPERLSDKSIAYNVCISGTGIDGSLTIGAYDEPRAREIVDAINNGAAWITLNPRILSREQLRKAAIDVGIEAATKYFAGRKGHGGNPRIAYAQLSEASLAALIAASAEFLVERLERGGR